MEKTYSMVLSYPQFPDLFLPELNVLELLKLRDRLQVC